MASVTTSLDTTYLRVGVNLSGWAADGPVDVYRVHADGSRNIVRGMSAVSGGAAFGWDYETPLSASITYEAWNGGTLVASSATTLTAPSKARLSVPGLPGFGGAVVLAKRPEFRRPRQSATLTPIGRVNPIVKSDTLKAPSFTLPLLTFSDSDAYRLMSTLEVAPVLLLRVPGHRVIDWCYVSTGNVSEAPLAVYFPGATHTDTDTATWAAWEVECQVTDSPVGDVFGDPTATYQASLNAYATYSARLSANATYLDALRAS